MPFSMPFTIADIPMRLDTPRMMPSMVSSERNLCAQISLRPMAMALEKFIERKIQDPGSKHQISPKIQIPTGFYRVRVRPGAWILGLFWILDRGSLCFVFSSSLRHRHQLNLPCRLRFLTEKAARQFIETLHFIRDEGLDGAALSSVRAQKFQRA